MTVGTKDLLPFAYVPHNAKSALEAARAEVLAAEEALKKEKALDLI